MAGPEDLKSIGGEGLKKPPEPKGSVKGPKDPEKKWAAGKKDDKEGIGTPDKDQARKDVATPKKTPEEETPEAKPEEAKTTTPRIPGEPGGEEEDKERRSPMGETPLEGAGKVGEKVGETGEKISKAGKLAGDITSAAGAPEVGEPVKWAAKGGDVVSGFVRKGGKKMKDAGQRAAEEGKRDEDEEDVETSAKIAADEGKKKLKWLKWPAIIGGVGCVGCAGMLVIILLPVLIITTVLNTDLFGNLFSGTNVPEGALPVPIADQKQSACPSSFCGPTAGAMVLGYYRGVQGSAQSIVDEIDEKANLAPGGQCRASSEGYSIGEWYGILTQEGIMYHEKKSSTIDDLKENYNKGNPTMVLVTMHGYFHFIVIVGFSDNGIIYHDPYGGLAYQEKSFTDFQNIWNTSGNWAGFWSGQRAGSYNQNKLKSNLVLEKYLVPNFN